jgi:ABC-type glycerol-3-phosphate transport system substrate-binding protein
VPDHDPNFASASPDVPLTSRRTVLKAGAATAFLAFGGSGLIAACTSSNAKKGTPSTSGAASPGGAASSAGAPGTKSFKGVTLNVACNPTDIEPAKAAGALWSAKTGGTVNAKVIPYAERATDYATMIVNKDPFYDVLFASSDFVSNFGDRLYADLGNLDGATTGLVPAALKQLTKGGKLYAAPLFADMELFIYNKADWTAAGLDPTNVPTTWDELYALAPKLASGSREACVVPWNSIGVNYWKCYYNSLGAQMFNEDMTQLLFNTDAGLQTWQAIGRGFQGKWYGQAGSNAAGDADTQLLFNQNLGASEINTTGFWAEAQSSDPQYKVTIGKGDVGVTTMPGIKAGTSGSIIVAEGFGVNKFGKQQDAALDFIRYTVTPDFQKQLVLGKAGTSLPPSLIATNSDPDVVSAYPIAPILTKQATSQLTSTGNAPYNWNAPFVLGLTNLSKGTWTAEQAHDATVKAVQKLIVQYLSA